jgi:phosphoglycolate phosphatase
MRRKIDLQGDGSEGHDRLSDGDSKARTLIFDLDGTLSDPLEGIWRSVNHTLEAIGEPLRSRQEVARYIGPPLDQTFRTFVGGADDARIAELIRIFRERYGRIGYRENELYSGISESLRELRNKGHRLGVCTSKRADFAEKILELHGLREYVEFVDGGDVGIAKANQLASLLASGAIDHEAWMIGDRAVDVEAARANGLKAVGVLWGYGSREELEGAGPVRILVEPAELRLLPA